MASGHWGNLGLQRCSHAPLLMVSASGRLGGGGSGSSSASDPASAPESGAAAAARKRRHDSRAGSRPNSSVDAHSLSARRRVMVPWLVVIVSSGPYGSVSDSENALRFVHINILERYDAVAGRDRLQRALRNKQHGSKSSEPAIDGTPVTITRTALCCRVIV